MFIAENTDALKIIAESIDSPKIIAEEIDVRLSIAEESRSPVSPIGTLHLGEFLEIRPGGHAMPPYVAILACSVHDGGRDRRSLCARVRDPEKLHIAAADPASCHCDRAQGRGRPFAGRVLNLAENLKCAPRIGPE